MSIRALSITSFAFLILGVIYLAGAFNLPMGTADRPGAGFFPLIVGILLIALSLPLFLRALKKKTKGEDEEPFPQGKDLRRVVFVASALIFFAVFLKTLGYGVCSAILMGATLKVLGMRNWGKIALASLLTAAISYYIFATVLDAPLPRGILFG